MKHKIGLLFLTIPLLFGCSNKDTNSSVVFTKKKYDDVSYSVDKEYNFILFIKDDNNNFLSYMITNNDVFIMFQGEPYMGEDGIYNVLYVKNRHYFILKYWRR